MSQHAIFTTSSLLTSKKPSPKRKGLSRLSLPKKKLRCDVEEKKVENDVDREEDDRNLSSNQELGLEVCPVCQFPFKYLTGQSARWHVSECTEITNGDAGFIGECPAGVKCDSCSSQHYRKYSHSLQAAARSGGTSREDQEKLQGKCKESEKDGSPTGHVVDNKQHGSGLSTMTTSTLSTQCSDFIPENSCSNLGTEGSESNQSCDFSLARYQSTNSFSGNFEASSDPDQDSSETSNKNENSDFNSNSVDCPDNILQNSFIGNDYLDICDEIDAELETNSGIDCYYKTEELANEITVHPTSSKSSESAEVKIVPDSTCSSRTGREKNKSVSSCNSRGTQSSSTSSTRQVNGSFFNKTLSNKSLVQQDVGIYFGLRPIKKPKRDTSNGKIANEGHLKPSEWRSWGSSDGKRKQGNTGSKPAGGGKPTEEKNSGAASRKKQCPFYKKIPDTGFTVDAFSYGDIPGCTAYFLSHFHYDHYGGLTKNFKNSIYCSKITSNLVTSKLRVPSQYVHVLPMHQSVCVEGVKVCLLYANHCPGSVMFLFQLPNGRTILHTGDFRATTDMANFPELSNKRIDVLYLDTTYCLPYYNFPTQTDTIDFAVSLAEKAVATHPKTLIVCGSYTIGKERVFVAVAKALDCKICVRTDKKRVLDCLEWEEINNRLTTEWEEAKIHVLPMNSLTIKGMEDHLRSFKGHFTHILAFKPTGWTYTDKMETLDQIKPVKREFITIYVLYGSWVPRLRPATGMVTSCLKINPSDYEEARQDFFTPQVILHVISQQSLARNNLIYLPSPSRRVTNEDFPEDVQLYAQVVK